MPETPRIDPEQQLLDIASMVEGALFETAMLHRMDASSLAEMHLTAARDMKRYGELAVLAAGESTGRQELDDWQTLNRRSVAYGFTMLAIERTADDRDPAAQPPPSVQMRARARERYSDSIDACLDRLPPFPLG